MKNTKTLQITFYDVDEKMPPPFTEVIILPRGEAYWDSDENEWRERIGKYEDRTWSRNTITHWAYYPEVETK